jgi:hypothetical protein
MKTQQNYNKMQVKPRVKMTTTKIGPMGFSLHHTHFIEHFVSVIENPPQEYDDNPKKL